MTPANALQLYVAFKLHFSTPDYDAIKFNYKTKNKPNFSKRNDKNFFNRLARQNDPHGILISNLSHNPDAWIGDILDQRGKDRYIKWKKRQEALTYYFKEDIKKLSQSLGDNLIIREHQHPVALRLYMRGMISLDTLVILDAILDYYPHWAKELKDDPTWKKYQYLIPKYRPFLSFDVEKFYNLVQERFVSDK